MAKVGQNATRHGDLAGAPPQLATVQDLQGSNPPLSGRLYQSNMSSSHMKSAKLKINLKAVAVALAEEGLDPALEMVRILKAQVPLLSRAGAPVINDDGTPLMVDALDADIKLRMLNEMLQYTQPKLKAVEMKVSGALELSSEQLDTRLAALLAKAAGGR